MQINKYADALINTLLYSDIFNFPLNKDELWYFLKNSQKISKSNFQKVLQFLPDEIMKVGDYYCLKNRSKIVALRIKQEKINNTKFLLAKKIAFILSKIPTIKFIGLSGSLANKNAKKSDDIDFFIITKSNTMWVTRLFCLLTLEILGKRRKRISDNWTNKICLNMFMEERSIYFSSNRHDIYTAHEIAQLKPLFDKEDTYKKFMMTNGWIKLYMPNVMNKVKVYKNNNNQIRNLFGFSKLINKILLIIFTNRLIEYAVKKIQIKKLNKHITSEEVTDSLLAFHPDDYRGRVINIYKEKLKGKKFSNNLVFTKRLWYYFNMHNHKKLLIFLLIFSFLLFPRLTYAQITPSPAIMPTCMPTQLNPDGCVPTNVEGFVAEYYKYGLGIVGGFAVLMIIFGSYQILISRGNPKILNDGKTIIAYAISGLLLAIFGYVFIEVIAKDILKIPGFG